MGYTDLKEMLKDARELASGANDLQLKGMLLDIQGAVYDLQEENRNLREEIHELKNTQISSERLIFKDHAYYDGKDGPFCSACWDSNNKLIRMNTAAGGGWQEYFSLECPQCKNTVQTSEKDPEYFLNKKKDL